MARITLFTENILEDATVSVTGDADSGYPEDRLSDRDLNLYWRRTGGVSGEIDIIVDRGGESGEVGFLAVEKHNMSGETWRLQYSGDNFVVDVNNAVTPWVQEDYGQVIRIIDPAIESEYWRLKISGEVVDPQCSEVFMSKGLELKVRFDENPEGVDRANVIWQDQVGGIERSTKKGDKRRVRKYATLLDETNSEITNFKAAMANLDNYSKPFYIKDHEGDYWMCRLVEPPTQLWATEGFILMSIRIIEKL